MSAFPVNKKLIWDYDFTEKDTKSKSFKLWYIARVLVRGGSEDVAAIGLATIHNYLLQIVIPKQVLDFWLWYFSRPDIEAKYGHLGQLSKSVSKGV